MKINDEDYDKDDGNDDDTDGDNDIDDNDDNYVCSCDNGVTTIAIDIIITKNIINIILIIITY